MEGWRGGGGEGRRGGGAECGAEVGRRMCGLAAPATTFLEHERGYGGAARERGAKPSGMANVKVGTMIRNQQARVEGGRRLRRAEAAAASGGRRPQAAAAQPPHGRRLGEAAAACPTLVRRPTLGPPLPMYLSAHHASELRPEKLVEKVGSQAYSTVKGTRVYSLQGTFGCRPPSAVLIAAGQYT